MFAVPGWSVSADALATQRPESAKDANTKTLKKRKRGQGRFDAEGISADKLPELREKHIEEKKRSSGKSTGASHGSLKAPKKKGQRSESSKPPNAIKGRSAEDSGLPTAEAASPATHVNERQQKAVNGKDGASASHDRPVQPHEPNKLTALQSSMRDKLISSRFRYLNQTLYTTPSQASLKLFAENPAFFDEYHQGFRRQVAAWPENPVDGFVAWIKERGAARPSKHLKQHHQKQKHKPKDAQDDLSPVEEDDGPSSAPPPLPRNFRTGTCTIADLGCGDAQLAHILTSQPPPRPLDKTLKLKIQSFDLASSSPLVTVADMRHLPLADGSVDVAVFCLALMGTNWVEFMDEAWRVLRWKGECWVAEEGSRVVDPQAAHAGKMKGKGPSKAKAGGNQRGGGLDGDEGGRVEEMTSVPKSGPDVSPFVAVLRRRGFVLQGEADTSNKMFVRMRFVKATHPHRARQGAGTTGKGRKWAQDADDDLTIEEESRVLKPCVYKTR